MNMNAHRKMTPKGQMSSSGMGPAVTHLPPHLKALFEPNAPLEHVPQLTKRKMPPYVGLVDFADKFETQPPPERKIEETPKERRERLALEKMQRSEAKLQEEVAKWDPQAADERKTDDAYKTLFVGRISFETTEKQLRHEFEQYGSVKKIRLVEDEDGKSRGYAFIEYEKESDLKAAYKQADGKKIDGRRVVVDVERGRTVRDWRPRKYGGGIGDTRKGGPDVNVKYSGREPISQVKVGGYGGADDRYRPRERSRSRSRGRATTGGGGGAGSSRDGRRESRRRSPSRSRSRSRGRDHRDRSRDRGSGGRDRDRHRERRDSRDYQRSDRGGSRRDR